MNIESSNQYVGMFGYVNGATIKNLTLENITVKSTYSYNSTSNSYGYLGGLIGYAKGTSTLETTIENVGIIGTSIVENATKLSNGMCVGGLVGFTDNYTTITNAYTTSNVEGNLTSGRLNIGGLVGYSQGTIEKAYSTGEVTGTSTTGVIDIGGLVGYTRGANTGSSNASIITNAYSTSSVIGTSTSGNLCAGGLVGYVGEYNGYRAQIANTYAVGKINVETSGLKTIGGLISSGYASYTTVTNSYWSPETTRAYRSITASEKPMLFKSMLYLNTYTDWDFDTVWDIDDENTLPYLQGMSKPTAVNASNYSYLTYEGDGTEDNPFIITTKEHLQGIKNNLSAHYKLGNNIDTSGIENFEPIGNATYPFTGTLDGAGFTISNVNIDSAEQYVGMFGYVNGGTIKNLTLENITVRSTYSYNSTSNYVYAGGLAGYTIGTKTLVTTIENVAIKGTSKVENINPKSNGVELGGLVGLANSYTIISKSYSTAEVVGNAVAGTIYAGGLAGLSNGTISTSYSTGNVTVASTTGESYVGGITGYSQGTIEKAYSIGEVTATSTSGMIYVGGLVGYTKGANTGTSNAAIITNAYSTSNVVGISTSGNIRIGGLVGCTGYITSNQNCYYATITNTYAVGNVTAQTTGTKNIGGLRGYNGISTLKNSYWSPETTKVNSSATTTEIPKFFQEMLYSSTYDNWDFDTIWDIDEGSSLPYLLDMQKPTSVNASNYSYLKYEGDGTASNPYIIRTKEQLQGIRNNLNQAHYKLGNNIDVSGIENFEPIGNVTYPFTGTLDGAGFTISNINIDLASQYVGLFGYTNGAIIKDLTIENITVKNNYKSSKVIEVNTGAVVGYSKGSTFQNIKVTGTSSVENNTEIAYRRIGGFAGSAENNTNIIEVNSNANVSVIVGASHSTDIGGLIGRTYNSVTITKSYATGNVTSQGATTVYAGGLVGELNNGTINSCYSTGNVDVNSTGSKCIGGLVGKSAGTIENVYSTSNVNVNEKKSLDDIGGLIGYNDASLTNAYAVGRIDIQSTSTSGSLGGLLGASVNNRAVNNSYWSPETTGQYVTSGEKGKGKLLSNMLYSTSYDNWDFENVWGIQEGQTLPYLQGIDVPSEISKTNYTYIEYDGKGTIEAPNIIRTEEQLQGIENDLIGTHYELGNNINVTKNFKPIGNAIYPFTGTLDGQGFTISNVNIESAEQNVGMFGYTSGATIKNLILKDINVKSTYSNNSYNAFVGGLVGYAINNTLIEGVEILGISEVSNVAGLSLVRIGGAVGELNKSSLNKVGTTAKVNANSTTKNIYAGGIAGYIAGSSTNKANIANAYSTGEIEATSTSGTIWAGGLTGYADTYTNISNVYAVGKITEVTSELSNKIGGLVGNSATSNVTIVSSYYSPETTEQYVGVIGKAQRFIDMLKSSTFDGWFNTQDSVWTIEEGNTLPYFKDMEKPTSVNKENYTYLSDAIEGDGTSTNPYIIKTEEQLQNMLVLQGGDNIVYFELGNDIEITKNFTPIGDNVCPFSSILDGKGYTIKNMQITSSNQYIGMFGHTNGAEIKNLTLENVKVKSIYASTNSADSINLGNASAIGGLIGYAIGTTVENVQTIGESKIESNTEQVNSVYVGGLIGFGYGTSKNATSIKTSSTSGEVLGEATSGVVLAGGLIGATAYSNGYVTVEEAYSIANVKGTSTTGVISLGGLVGTQNSPTSIINAFATGKTVATSTSGQEYVGGLVGNLRGGTITNAYAVGKVSAESSGTKNIGGLVGNKSTAITSSYFSPETTGQMPNGSGKEKFLCSMLKQNSYENWDFTDVWGIKEGASLPYLKTLAQPESIKKENYEYIDYEGDGTEENPYLIKTEEQLKGMKYILDGVHYKLANDIDLQENFEPIGDETYPFASTFDGDNHTIRNMTIESAEQNVGMFGCVNTGTIKNLILENVEINTTNSVNIGTLVGSLEGTSTIDNVRVIGISNIEYTNDKSVSKYIGGLIGYINSNSTSKLVTVINSNSVANISATISSGNTRAGGLIGATVNKVTIEKSYAKGEVSIDQSLASNYSVYVGGLVGDCGNKAYTTVKTSYATGNVLAKGSTVYIGGLVGDGGTITNAYAIGNVSASASGYLYIGGLIGKANSATISNTYAVGQVRALSNTQYNNMGGLTGLTGSITDSYWSPKTTKQETSAGGTAKTIQELLHETTYENWDFADIWTIEEGTSLAYLKDLEKPDGINGEDIDFETRVRVYVKDENGVNLPNAEFIVKNEAGEVVRTGATNSKGIYNILDLEPGIYTLEQTLAPVSYIKDTTIRTFKLTEEGTTVDAETNEELTLNIINEQYKIPLKNLEKDTDKPIKGAVIGLFDDAGNAVTGIDGKVIRGTTDTNGNIVLTKMKAGTYKYKQTVAKLGYIIDEAVYSVTIAEDGTVTFAEDNAGVIYNEKIKTDITVTKVWNDNNNLKGKRPDSVKLKLFANGVEVENAVVTEADNWQHTFTVDKYNNNSVQITYIVNEEAINEGDFRFYTGAVRGYTITNTYITPSNIPYKVEHYKQNDTLDGYVLAETENLTGTLEKTVTAVAKDYSGYILNTNVSGTIQKGIIVEDGSLVLKLYYDKLKTKPFNVNISNLDAKTSEPIANTKYDVWVRYSDGTKTQYPEQTTNKAGNITIPSVLGKSITRVYFKQTKMENGHKIDPTEKYVEIKVEGLTADLSLTGLKSSDIVAGIEDDTIYITQINDEMHYSNSIRINAIDSVDKDITIGGALFEVIFPDGAIKNITTNEEGIAEIKDITAPGTGTYLYEIRQLEKINGYNKKIDTIYANITFNNDGIITSVSIIKGDAKAKVIKEISETEEVTIANIDITEVRESNEIFSDYTLKIIERDKDTNNLVGGVNYKVTQASKIDGINTTMTVNKTTNENGEAIFDVAKSSEITFTIRRTSVPSEYKLVKEQIQVKVRNNNGEYELIEAVPGVTINTENNEIIVDRTIYKTESVHNTARQKINNTIYITKVDEKFRPLQNVDMQLRAYKCENGEKIDKDSPIATWNLTTDSKGLAQFNISEIPEWLMEEEGKLEFWITEITVPIGYERPETDIGFEVVYEFSDKGKLEIVTMNVLDGASYYHIADQTYDQYEEEQYIQSDIKLKVINPHSKNPDEEVAKLNNLQIEKVDSQNEALKLANATFKVTLTYPEVVLSTGKTKTFKTTTEVKTGTYGLGTIKDLNFPVGTTKVEIQELTAPNGYILDSTKITLNVTNTAGVITVVGENASIKEDGTIKIQIENTKKEDAKPYNIVIQKRDSNDNSIIYSVTEFDVKVICGETTKTYNRRTKNGKASINSLNGKGNISIEIKEVGAPVGYKLSEEVKTVNINKEKLSTGIELVGEAKGVKINNNTIYVDVYDEPDEEIPALQIRKVDSKNTYMGLENAKFTITIPDENNTTRRVSTSANGYANIILANGISGRYIIEETEAPKGYYTTKKIALDITFDEDKNVTSCNVVSNLGEEFSSSVLYKNVKQKRINITIADEKIEIPSIKTYGIHIDKVSTTDNNIKLNNVYFDINIEEENGLNYALVRKTEDYKGIYITELTGSGKIKLSLQEVSAPSEYTGTSGVQELIFTRDEQTQELVLDKESLKNISANNITIDNINHIIHIRVKNEPNDETVVEPSPIPPVPTVTPTPVEPTPTPIDPTPTIKPTPTPEPSQDPTNPELKDPTPTPITSMLPTPSPGLKSPIITDPEQTHTFTVALEKANTYNRKIKVTGAQYIVYVLNEETNEQISKIGTTNVNGKIYIPKLSGYGDFTITIVEINAPAGYAIDEYRHTIKIHRDEESKLITIRETDLGKNAEVKIDDINKIVNVAFNEAPSTIGLAIYKRDSEDEKLGLENVEFKVTDDETNAEYKLTTGDEGMDYTTLPIKQNGAHTFTIKEISSLEGYEAITPIKLRIEYEDGLISNAIVATGIVNYAYVEKQTAEYVEISILNEKETEEDKFTYDIELIKGDAYYPAVIFKDALININVNNEIGMKGLTKTALTDEEGKIYINKVYGAGQVDINITELIPPTGRRFDKKVKAVRLIIDKETGKIKLDKQTSNVDVFIDNETRKITIRVRNYPDGTFIIGTNKVDAEDTDLILTGAEYKIQLEGDTKNYYSKENISGLLTLSEIPMPSPVISGTYTYLITETKAPKGYVLDTEPIRLTIEVANDNGIITITNVSIEDKRAEIVTYGDEYIHLKLMDNKAEDEDKYTITLTKIDSVIQEQILEGATIGIKVKAESGEEYYKEVKTDEFGQIKLEEIAGTGRIEVTIEEFEAPTNYMRIENAKTIVFTRNPETKEIIIEPNEDEALIVEEKEGNLEIILKNELDLTKAEYITIRKVQKNTDIGLKGAIIVLKDETGKELQRRTTDEDGNTTFIVELGKTYCYEEITPPIGYTLNEQKYSFKVLDDGEIEDIEGNRVIENTKVTMKEVLTITKKRTGTEETLAGAVIGIFDAEGNEIVRGTTLEDGTVTFGEIEVGDYYYKEIKAPDGYILNETEYHFTVENDGTLTLAEESTKVIYNDRVLMKETLTITKKRAGTETTLAGAVIGIFDTEGNEITRGITLEDGTVTFEGLEVGEYYYKEITPPNGYILNETMYYFTVGNDGELTLGEGSTRVIYNDVEKITILVRKVWEDTEAQREKRPANIVIQVKNGNTVVETKTVSNTTENIEFSELPKYNESGNEINYTVEELEENEGDLKYYTSATIKNDDGTYTITNTFTVPENRIKILVRKVWEDTEAQREKRPANIVIQIKKGDVVVATKTVSNTTENIEFGELPKYDENGNEINYKVEELEENEGDLKYYTSKVVKNADGTYTITNTFIVPDDKITILVHKVWEDTEAQKEKRPANIVIQIKNGNTVVETKTISNTTTEVEFTDLPKYDENGNEIIYLVKELEENEGDLRYYVSAITKNADGTYTITNTFKAPDDKITIKVHKVWEDTEAQREKRPANIVIQIKNGNTVVETKTISNTTTEVEFTDLPKYDENGNEVNYTVEEIEENEGDLKYYESSVTGDIVNGFIITNTFKVPESMLQVKIRKVDVTTKVGLPGAVIELISENGDIVEGTTGSDGYVTFSGLEVGKTYTYREKIPPAGYSLNINEYSFSVNELGEIVDIVGNRIIENDLELWNSRITIKVKKVWEDTEGQRVKRPANIVIQLKNGDTIVETKIVSNTTTQIEFADLPQYNENKYEINYTVGETEENEGDLEYYVSSVTGNIADGFIITNTFKVPEELLQVTIRKIDAKTLVGLKGATITIIDENGNEQSAVTNDDGYVTFTKLEVGKTYIYKETTPPIGYTLNTEEYSFRVNELGEIVDIKGNRIIENNRVVQLEALTITKLKTGTDIRLAGAVIGIFNTEGKEIERKTTSEDGTVTFTGLEPGDYYYKEIEAPTRYSLNNTEYHFTITNEGRISNEENTQRIIYNDPVVEEIRVDIPIYKMDLLTKELLSGAKIGLYDDADNLIEEKISTEDGKVIFTGLTVGRTYKYKEITAPTGYVLNDTMYSFKIAEDGSVEYYGETIEIDGVRYIVIYNEPLKVDVTIYKADLLTKELLSGAKIGLYDDADNLIEEKVTADGKVVFTGLIAGRTYKYKEITAPAGYVLNDTMYNFKIIKNGTIEYSGETIEIDGIKYMVIYNEPLRVDVPIYKADLVTKALLSGAKIKLYDEAGNALGEKVTTDGKVVFTGLLAGKTYKYNEVEAPDGYILNNTMYSFKILEDGTIEYYGETIEIDGIKYIVIYNEQIKIPEEIRVDVPIYKADLVTKALLSGAKIKLYDEAGNALGEKVTADGKVVFTGLLAGKTYKYNEVEAPEGYILNNAMYSFKILEDGTIEYYGETIEIDGEKYIVIYNELVKIPEEIKVDVPIYKMDLLTKTLLSGARIGLYDADGHIIQQKITAEDGRIVFRGLTVGRTYKYKEITAPTGYVLNDTMYSFKIAEDGSIEYYGETIEIDGIKYIVIYNEQLRIDVPIYKLGKGTDKGLAGAVIGLYDTSGQPILVDGKPITAMTNEEGIAIFKGLNPGAVYQYREEVAPIGYEINTTMYAFRIKEDGTIIYDEAKGIIYDELLVVIPTPPEIPITDTKLPQTGANSIVLGVMMMLTGMSVAGTIYYKRKIR